mmetsp:Transcript_26989/g.20194  ORF Transcript_26989/g.20194 Transcript_26989/m.20194 type:complete len:103 (+) Transcript_26989:613-921(+)
MLVGNKIDLPDRMVSSEEGKAVADFYKINFIETSALTGENVNSVFETITREILSKKVINPQAGGPERHIDNSSTLNVNGADGKARVTLDKKGKQGGKKHKCC